MRCLFLILLLLLPMAAHATTPFRQIEDICNALEKEGFKLNEPWHENGWRDYTCATAYLPMTKDSGVPTNIAYYVESEQPDEITDVYLVLNVNDDGAKNAGKQKYLRAMTTLFRQLELDFPNNLVQALKEETDMAVEQESATIRLEVVKGATNTFQLVIHNRQGG